MSHFNFILPSNKDELLNETNDFYVKDLIGAKEINARLREARVQFKDEGVESILETFDVFFSVLYNAETLPMDIVFSTYETLHKMVVEENKTLGFVFEDKESLTDEVKIKLLNVLKMLLYVYIQIVLFIDQKNLSKNDRLMKGKKKAKAEEAHVLKPDNILLILYNIVDREINFLWDPPVVEESFVSMVSEVCYRFLQNPNYKGEKEYLSAIFNVIGILIKEYNHGTTFVIRLVQLIKMTDHLVGCIPSGVSQLVRDYNCKGVVHDLVREITEWQTDEKCQDSQGAKNCALVLSEMAILMPDLMIPELLYLNRYLNHESATLRNSVLSVITEVVIKVLTKHDLSEEEKESRDDFLEILLEHMYDVHALVRTKTIQHWARLQKENAIPKQFQLVVLERVIEKLRDKGALVRKSALNCISTFLSYNPYSANLSLEKMKKELQQKQKELGTLKLDAKFDTLEEEWKIKEEKLREVITKALENDDEEEDDEPEVEIPKEQVASVIRNLIKEDKFEEAFKLCRLFDQRMPEWKELLRNNRKNKVDMYLMLLGNIFVDLVKLVEEMRAAGVQSSIHLTDEDLQKIETLETNIDFLKDSVKFLELINTVFGQATELLETTVIGDMHGAVEFFIVAYQFELDCASDGILAMLRIMQRNEQERKDIIVNAFKTIFLKTDSNNMEDHTSTIVKRLVQLVKNVPINNVDDLQCIISEWTSQGVLDNSIIDMFWKYFTKRVEVSDDDSLAAAKLLKMAAVGKKTIITKNIKLVAQVGFAERGEQNMCFLGSCCELLAIAGKGKIDITSKDPPFKIKPSDSIFTNLSDILIDKFFKPVDFYYLALSAGVEFIYRLCSKPDKIAENLIKSIWSKLTDEVPQFVLIRICQLLGAVALRHLDYLEENIYKELKRRNNIRENIKNSKIKDKPKNDKKSKGSKNSTLNESSLKNASMDEATLEGAQAEDGDAEFILKVLENDTVSESSLLGKCAELVVSICENPDQYNDVQLQGAAVIALIRCMIVSSRFCEKHIRLLFTIFEKTNHPDVKISILVHCSDLLTRFPNIVEPWTPRIYQRLQDKDIKIRQAAFYTLSHLILGDMIRAHNHISEMVCCMVDEDDVLSKMCKTFLLQLANKENNLYNILPDIFSYLMDVGPEKVSDENVHTIMKYLFELMDKHKQMENLVDRFCCKFRLSEDVRHHRSIAYCLSLITYNEKALKKLQENFPTYKHLVQDAEVYGCFKNIFNACNKPQIGKGDLKGLVTELEQLINSVFEMNEDGLMKPPPVPAKTAPKRKKKVQKKQKADSEDEEDSPNEEVTPSKKSKSRRKKVQRTVDSDSD